MTTKTKEDDQETGAETKPEKWKKPDVESVDLPEHAQTTGRHN